VTRDDQDSLQALPNMTVLFIVCNALSAEVPEEENELNIVFHYCSQ
jgi:hypothetical protein